MIISYLLQNNSSYSLELTKEEYLSLSKDATQFSFGDQYLESRIKSSFKLKNGCLLIHWNDSPGAFMGYGLYEGVKTLYAGDPESVYSISDQVELKKDKGSYQPAYRNQWTLFELEVINGKHVNADAGRTVLSEVFNIDIEILDYTKESLKILDNSISANWNRVNSNDVLSTFVSYIGQIVSRDHNLLWLRDSNEKDWPYFLLNKNGGRINLDRIIYRRMFDCGLMLEASGAHYGVELEVK